VRAQGARKDGKKLDHFFTELLELCVLKSLNSSVRERVELYCLVCTKG
jgi:hypothetical protein